MSERIRLTHQGEELHAELALPPGGKTGPLLLLIQEWWGVNDHVRSLVDRFAQEGFVTCAPDLYHGKTTKNADEAGKLMAALDKENAVAELAAWKTHLSTHERVRGKTGVTGFCMGGALSFLAACRMADLGAVVPFYGLSPIALDVAQMKAPILAHFAKRDEWAKASEAESLQGKIREAGGTMELCLYDADHAFMNDTRPEVYSEANARAAWAKTVQFLKEKLS